MCKLFAIFVLVCLFFTVVLSNNEDELEAIENDEIHFRVANGKPALVGQIPYQFTYHSFHYNAYVKKMPLASRDKDYANKYCLASGFGRTNETTKSAILQWAYLKVISKRLCSHIHNKNMRDFVCTESGISYTMKGDSGGPLMCLNTSDPADKGHGVVVGIVSGHSYRVLKKKRKRETYFTRVSKYKNFIRNSTFRLNLPDLYVIWLSVIIFMFD